MIERKQELVDMKAHAKFQNSRLKFETCICSSALNYAICVIIKKIQDIMDMKAYAKF